jgi:hypothetical protein
MLVDVNGSWLMKMGMLALILCQFTHAAHASGEVGTGTKTRAKRSKSRFGRAGVRIASDQILAGKVWRARYGGERAVRLICMKAVLITTAQ